MTREKLFKFAAEEGWDKVLDVSRETHSLSEIAAKTGKKQRHLEIELQAMCAMGLLYLSKKAGGGYVYVTTVLGVKFLQEQNKKKGLTYRCLLCGTTTGQPHVCPCFHPEFRE
ncbi:MAG: hypothetical protein HYT64_02090 [Candidatus Yanofskybacteria bacterium]|nr:hypothetical protein [Candidatus Yanofskybacteria bacterium]